MEFNDLNYLAVFVGGVIIFFLGGLWYSPVMFAKPWIALQGKTEEEMRAGSGAMPAKYAIVFLCGLIASFVLAFLVHVMRIESVGGGMHIGALVWFGFTATSSFATALFSFKPTKLWLIDATYYLVAYVIVGAMHGAWH